MRWADLGDDKHGLSILNNSKYGYDAVGNMLRLTLLRSPIDPDPEADRGHHHFHYALYPHAGTWKDALTVRHGYEYNYQLTALVTTPHAGALPSGHSFASVSPENVVLTAVKKAEDTNSLIFRVYEWAGKEATAEFHVPPGATAATVTNMQETPEGGALEVSGDVVKAQIHPYEILTIRVDYPAPRCGRRASRRNSRAAQVETEKGSGDGALFATLSKRIERMSITSPFFVVPVIVIVFALSIWFATSSKEDGHSSH